MADQLQLRRGSTSQVLVFTGAQGEVIVDTTLNALVVQDGLTAGGFYAATGKQLTQGTFYYNEDVGSAANAYVLVPKSNTNTPSSYQDGVQFGFVSIHANTGPSTANFQGLGVRNLKYPGGVDPLAGEIFGRIYLIYDSVNGWFEIQRKALGPPPQIRTIAASVGSNALTVGLAPCVVDFRAASLSNGNVSTFSVTSTINLTVPAGATLGTVSAAQSRIMILAIQGPVNVELAVVNLASGINLDETTLVNTTAITSGATSGTTIYSTTARTGVPFRVVGYVESTQATAGTWATVPSTVQGTGGQAMAALGSLGFGQSWSNVTGSRVLGTTYTNTTGKPIMVVISCTASTAVSTTVSISINGVSTGVGTTGPASIGLFASPPPVIVPHGYTYAAALVGGTPTLNTWSELR